jgi:WhiB family transcriptional regulator, redox-sensing transcriptional regulator
MGGRRKVLPFESWMNYGACSNEKTSIFFVESGDNLIANLAKDICHSCIHESTCLEYAIRHHIRDGIWGGTSRTERLLIASHESSTKTVAKLSEAQ